MLAKRRKLAVKVRLRDDTLIGSGRLSFVTKSRGNDSHANRGSKGLGHSAMTCNHSVAVNRALK